MTSGRPYDAVGAFQLSAVDRQSEIDRRMRGEAKIGSLHDPGHLEIVILKEGHAMADIASEVSQKIGGTCGDAGFKMYLCSTRFGIQAYGQDEQVYAYLCAQKRGCFHGKYGLRL
jgi:hypothetical protein